MWIFSGFKNIFSAIGGYRPVIMLAGTIYPCKRFFMKKTNKVMLKSYFFHHFHGKLIVIGNRFE